MVERRRAHRILFALGVAATMLLTAATYTGLGISPDSGEYLSVAQNLLQGKGVSTATSLTFSFLGDVSEDSLEGISPSVQYAPLYPALIAFVSMVTGKDTVKSAWYIGLVGGVSFIIVSSLIVSSCALFRPFGVYGGILLLAAAPFWANYTMLLSEALYLPLSAIFQLTLHRYLSEPRPGKLLLSASVAAAASLTRYNGVAMIAAGVILLLLHHAYPLSRRVWHALLFSLVSALPLAGWLCRNWYLTGTLMGERAPSLLNVIEALSHTTTEIWKWFLPPQVLRQVSPSALLVVSALLVTLYVVLRWRYASVVATTERLRNTTRMNDVASCLFVLHVGVIVATEAIVAVDWPNMRLLCPAWVPLVCMLLWMASVLWWMFSGSPEKQRARAVFSAILLLVATGVLVNGIGRSLHYVIQRQRNLQEYRTLCSRLQQTYARCSLPQDALLVSNDTTTVYYALRKASVFSPRKYHYNSWKQVVPSEVEILLQVAKSGRNVLLIWIHTTPERGYLYTLYELSSRITLKPLCESEDISIYAVLPNRHNKGPRSPARA